MRRSQLNIKIPEEILKSIKKQAIQSGKTLTEHIVNLIVSSLDDETLEQSSGESVVALQDLSKRLVVIESEIQNFNYIKGGLTQFTDQEAIHCTDFIRGVFEKTINLKGFKNKKKAFSELLEHITTYQELNDMYSLRLKEVILIEDSDPFTAKELNDLSHGDKCKCPIRFGLINWTGKANIPSQQEICDKGAALLNTF
tara:strand:- start:265 stop:858 length:594 start_codon:yes stop_codon:yes gene_type:complete